MWCRRGGGAAYGVHANHKTVACRPLAHGATPPMEIQSTQPVHTFFVGITRAQPTGERAARRITVFFVRVMRRPPAPTKSRKPQTPIHN
ncbi:MAG: hypothetical protein IPL28_26570 [Chloroflexi bacterium]|nr:hypothetical protein [Chloroflexota bacterium]